MFARLGRVVVYRRWSVIAAWLVVAAALVAFAPQLSDITNSDQASFLPDSYESTQARELADRAFPQANGATVTGVIRRDGHAALGAADLARVSAVADALRRAAIDRVAAVQAGPQSVAPNRQVALVTVRFSGTAQDTAVQDALSPVREITDRELDGSGLRAGYTGQVAFTVDNAAAFADAELIIAITTVVLIVLLLLLIFRSPVAALLPIVTVGVVFAVSRSVIALAGKGFGFEIGQELGALLTVVLFGIGTDYILFLLFRVRERLRAGDDPSTAVSSAVARVGEALASAAGVVIAAFSVMVLATLGFFASMGPALAIAVAVTLVAALTLIPAVLSLLGTAVFWPSRSWRHEPSGGVYARLGRLVTARPAIVVTATGIVLLTLAANVVGLSTNYDTLSQLPDDTESARAFESLQDGFPPGALNPTNVYLTGNGDALRPGQVQRFATALGRVDPVAGVLPPELAADGTVAQVSVQLASNPFSDAALDAIEPLRAAADRAAPAGTEALVGGQTAAFTDLRDATARDLSVIFPVAAVLIAVILALLLRSLVAPLYLMVAVALGYTATLGAAVLAFQAIAEQPGVVFILPIMLYLFVVAIGTDYNILMIARLREESRAGHDPRTAAALAVRHAGPTVAAAGAILAGTFASLMLGGVSILTQMGFGVTLGIVLAAFVGAPLLTPGITALLGHRAWWPGHGDMPGDGVRPAQRPPERAAARAGIRGTVHSDRGDPLAGGILTLIDLQGRQLQRVHTDGAGHYVLDHPPQGCHLLVGAARGHQPQALLVTADGTRVRRDVQLSAAEPMPR